MVMTGQRRKTERERTWAMSDWDEGKTAAMK